MSAAHPVSAATSTAVAPLTAATTGKVTIPISHTTDGLPSAALMA
jgi:hypothetical protein